MKRESIIDLVIRAQQQDADALNELCSACYQDVYRFAMQTVKNEDLAYDITQETFLAMLQHLDELKEPAAFSSWLRRITYHECTRYFKKKKEVYLDEPEEDEPSLFDLEEEDSPAWIPEEALLNKELCEALQEMTEALPSEQRAAFILHHVQNLSVKEIAEIQSVTEGTVKSRLNYSRKALQKAVGRYEQKNGVRLHSVAWTPLLALLLRRRGEAIRLSPGQIAGLQSKVGGAIGASVAAATAGTAATATTVTTTATVGGMGLFAKVAAVVLGVAIGSTALVGTVTLLVDSSESAPPAVLTTASSVAVTTTLSTTAPPQSEEPLPPSTDPLPPPDTSEEPPLPALIPEGCSYTVCDGEPLVGNGVDVRFPETVGVGDIYQTADYWFIYGDDPCLGWQLSVLDDGREVYPDIPETINGQPVTGMQEAFLMNSSILVAPKIPSTMVDMRGAFHGCSNLTTAPVIPASVLYFNEAFEFCSALTGEIEIHANPETFTWCFFYTEQPILLTGSSTMLEKLAGTTPGDNITVKKTAGQE